MTRYAQIVLNKINEYNIYQTQSNPALVDVTPAAPAKLAMIYLSCHGAGSNLSNSNHISSVFQRGVTWPLGVVSFKWLYNVLK